MIRKVLIREMDLIKIREDGEKWSTKGLETGGYLFGRIHPNMVAEITKVIDGGPKAKRTGISYSGDNEYASMKIRELREIDPEVRLIGEYHIHPWKGRARLSYGDLRQLSEVKELIPWFLCILSTKDEMKAWDLDGKNEREVPLHVLSLPDGICREDLLDRILRATRHEVLMKKTALLVGLGSGGSVVAKYLGCTGIGRIILVDKEELEVPNLIRHEGSLKDLGRKKVEICKEMIEKKNPFTVVEAYDIDVTEDRERVEELAMESDIILGASGSPRVNSLLNRISLDMEKPAVYGGMFEMARGGYVLSVKPRETACFNCLFEITSRAYSVDREDAKRYGLSEEELHAQQGLWIDISIPALIFAKKAVWMLEGKEIDKNFTLYRSNLEVLRLRVDRRDDCFVCNREGWIRKFRRRSLKERIRDFLKRR